jgi:hypothetical protein
MTSRLTTTLIILSLTTGVLLTLWGLGHMPWPEALPVSDSALRRYLLLLLASALAIAVAAKLGRRSPIVIGFASIVGIALLSGAIWPILVTLWFATASAILGRAVIAALAREKNSINWTTSLLVGAGLYGSSVGLLAHFPVHYAGIYAAALAAPLILGWRSIVELGALVGSWFNQSASARPYTNGLDVLIVAVAIVHFAVALMPEVGHDALAMHLFIPAHLTLRHQWEFDVGTYVWAVMPMLGDWIFAVGYMLAGETAARMINVGFIFVLGLLVRDLVRWAGGTALGARWAVLIFLSTPLTFTESSSLFIESIWSSLVVAGTLALLRACSAEGKPKVDLPVAGIFLGCALSAKAVTFTILPVLFLLLIWRYKHWFRPESHRGIMVGLALFLLLGVPPYANAYWLTGNPVFPLFNGLFQSPYYPPINFDAPTFERGVTWDVLYRVTFMTERYLEGKAGGAGFQWLLIFVPSVIAIAIARQRRVLALLAVGVLGGVMTFNSTAYLRYVFPSFVIFAVVVGVAISGHLSNRVWLRRTCYTIAGTAVGLNLLFLESGTYFGNLDLRALTSAESREEYLQTRLPIRNAVELVNRLNRGRTPVAVFSSPLTAGLTADGLYPTWYNHQFESSIKAANTERDLTAVLLNKDVDFIILDEHWGSSEKRLLIEGATEKIAVFGPISVRIWPKESRFRQELLANPDFTAMGGWSMASGDASKPKDGISVTVTSAATQVVPVKQGRRYLNTVKARCLDQPTQGRMQINWADAQSQFISADIHTFDCSPTSTQYSMEVIAPPKAAFAVVYTSGHTPTPMVFNENSLRQ